MEISMVEEREGGGRDRWWKRGGYIEGDVYSKGEREVDARREREREWDREGERCRW